MYKRIRIKNFKSLRDIDLKLRKVNVVVGPNGSGKSNLVYFFIFLKELINPSAFPLTPFKYLEAMKKLSSFVILYFLFHLKLLAKISNILQIYLAKMDL